MSESPSSGYAARLLLALLVVALALFLWAIHDAILLGFAAVLLAVAVHGIADVITTRTGLPRPLALALAGLLLIAGLVCVIWLFGTQLAAEMSGVLDRLPDAWDRARETLQGSALGRSLVADIEAFLSGDGETSAQDMLARAGSYTLPFASGATTALLVIFAAAFLAAGAGSYRRGALLLLPKSVDEKAAAYLDDAGAALKKWLFGITVDMVIIAALLGAALWALGVPAFVGLALIAGFAQFVPTIGPLIASIPGILLALTVSPMTALWTALAYLVISQLEANVVYPIIQKKTASVPPALNLLAILAFGLLFGPLGVLLATPILIVLNVLVVRFYVQDVLGKRAQVPGA